MLDFFSAVGVHHREIKGRVVERADLHRPRIGLIGTAPLDSTNSEKSSSLSGLVLPRLRLGLVRAKAGQARRRLAILMADFFITAAVSLARTVHVKKPRTIPQPAVNQQR